MALSLYQCSIPTYLQTLGGIEGCLAKGLTYCADQGVDPQSIADTNLYEDMWGFDKQIQSACHHSLGAIKGMQAGEFNPPKFQPDIDYEGLVRLVGETRAELEMFSANEIDALQGNKMKFQAGKVEIPFIAEDFLLSFSLPNFFFHATTSYDILRHRGVPIGKRDYVGRMRILR